ncbi:efflux RND transporter periplasmic adaptor subunit [Saccharospirillum mangrovi]|uniref:efflux RND transporter periplasmic adaptor subunit n=1 Tax=Saccharospirillum mangrovi TaxID=2161747 RepID=UPI000D33B06F|nr:HlyD family efflux transporter periplasmic adaptor subunit [Saccharospirillum mangrovi]
MKKQSILVGAILVIGVGGYLLMSHPVASESGAQQRGNAAMNMRAGLAGSRWGRSNASSNALQIEAIDVELTDNAPTTPMLAQVDAKRQETLTVPAEARVIDIQVQAGQFVSAGDALMTLSADSIDWTLRQQQASVAQQEAAIRIADRQHEVDLAALANARASYQREVALNNQGYSNAASLQTAEEALRSAELTVDIYDDEAVQRQADLEQARIALEQAQADADDLQPMAPFDAEVVGINVATGARLAADTNLMTLVDRSSLYARTQVPLSVYRRIRGQAIEAEAIIDDTHYPLTVTSLAASAETGAVALEVALPANIPVLINETIELQLKLPTVASYAVPQDAIYQSDRLYRIVDGALSVTTVNILGYQQRDGEQWALISLDESGEPITVLTTRLSQPTNGTPVTRVGNGQQNAAADVTGDAS